MKALKRTALTLACLGLLLPSGVMSGQKQRSTITDVELAKGQVLTGSVVDSQGKGVAGVAVRVRFNGLVVARTETNKAGRYAVAGLRAGVHQIATNRSRMTTRLWSGNAPGSAKTAAVLVTPTTVVRAQEYVDGGEVYYDDGGGYYDDGTVYEDGGYAPGISGRTIAGGLVCVGLIAGIAYWIDSENDGGGSGGTQSP